MLPLLLLPPYLCQTRGGTGQTEEKEQGNSPAQCLVLKLPDSSGVLGCCGSACKEELNAQLLKILFPLWQRT